MLKDKIKELCRGKGITIQKLEQEVGLSNGAISKWGKSKPKLESLEKVAQYFDIPISSLIEGTGTLKVVKKKNSVVFMTKPYGLTKLDPLESRMDEAYAILIQMSPDQQKTAIRLLKALAEEAKE